MPQPPFRDRREAGSFLASRLSPYAGRPDVVVLALPRGGVPVAYEIATALGLPLDVFVVRKLGVPGQRELAMGALSSGGVRVINDRVVDALGIPDSMVDQVVDHERAELERLERLYRRGRARADIRGKIVIVVDDGLATGASMGAAIAALKQQRPAKIVVAVPTAPSERCEALRDEVDEVICGITPEPFHAVGLWYEDFSQTTDDEVHELLARSLADREAHSVRVAAGDVVLEGNLVVPRAACGVVLFAHGSGSGRLSPRNRRVARLLEKAGLATLLIDLLTQHEERIDRRTAHLRFDIDLLARRLIGATDWLARHSATRGLPVGYFGASTGAAAALVAAAQRPAAVRAVVSRGGRPDLAGAALGHVRAPTLLIVGGNDLDVLELNRASLAQLDAARIAIIPGATHLFEEAGALDSVADLAREWFVQHLAPVVRGEQPIAPG